MAHSTYEETRYLIEEREIRNGEVSAMFLLSRFLLESVTLHLSHTLLGVVAQEDVGRDRRESVGIVDLQQLASFTFFP